MFGGALAYEWGILGIEGRLDATDVSLDLTGARYPPLGTEPPFDGLTAHVTVSDGTFDADRIGLALGERATPHARSGRPSSCPAASATFRTSL